MSSSSTADGGAATLRRRWAVGEVTWGGWMQLRDCYGAELLARSGLDWVAVDLQHGTASSSDLLGLLQAIAIGSTPSFVRVEANEHAAIGRALDLGAAGVIVPMVEDRHSAVAAVAACRYAPAGQRSWGPARAALGGDASAVARAGADAICAVMIETPRGVEAVREIGSVPGVDAIFVGPGDLAVSLGASPSLDAPDRRVERAILSVVAATAEAGVTCGVFAGGADAAARWAQAGVQMIALAVDAMLLSHGAARLLNDTRSAL